MGSYLIADILQRMPRFYPHGSHDVLRHLCHATIIFLASLFISLGVIGMMIGSALAKPLTDKSVN